MYVEPIQVLLGNQKEMEVKVLLDYLSSNSAQIVMYIVTPSKMAINHKAIVGFISLLLLKQVCRSVLKCHETASQMPSATVTNPNATWINEIMTIGLISIDVLGELVKLVKEGIIT